MESLSEYYAVSLPCVIGAFCALSPNNDYKGNLRSTATALRWFRFIHEDSISTSTYNHCKERALRCLWGEDFLSFTVGPKTRAFYLNILNPDDPNPVTIDGHLTNAAMDTRLTMKQAIWAKGNWNYEQIAGAIRAIGFCRDMVPNQVQSIVWHTWKRINRILHSDQLLLWQDFIPAEVITTLPVRDLSPVDKRTVLEQRFILDIRQLWS